MASRLILFAALAVATLVRIPHLRFIPVWDGRSYWDDCMQPALLAPFDAFAFNCFGHRSMLYMLTVAWPQYFRHGSPVLLNLANLALSLLTIYGFHRLVSRLFTRPVDASMLTLLFASMPVWTASSINLNPDFGVLTGFVFVMLFLVERRLYLAAAAGVFLVLSKEIGLLMWLIAAGLETLIAFAERDLDRRERVRRLLQRWIFAVPPFLYWLTAAILRGRAAPTEWTHAPPAPSLFRIMMTFDPSDSFYRGYIIDIFVLNFAWVMTIAIVAWLVAVLVRVLTKRALPLPESPTVRNVIFVCAVTIAVSYFITRFPTFNNPRYLMPAYPLVVITFGLALSALVRRPALRIASIVLAAGLQLMSMWRTIDPVSRFAFGTFKFGDHPMLKMTSHTGECCGHGRDQLVYNLQYTHFHYAQDELFEIIRPKDGEIWVISRHANWYLIGGLDPRTFHRTLRRENVIRPQLLSIVNFATGTPIPEKFRYIAYPNMNDAPELRRLTRDHDIKQHRVINEKGYRLAVFDFEKRR